MLPATNMNTIASMNEHVDAFLAAVSTFAIAHPNVRALVLVGSYARGTARPDSDIDVIVLVDDPTAFLDQIGWVRVFGDVSHASREYWGRLTALRIRYDSGLEVEFGLTKPEWALVPDAGTIEVLRDGFQVIFDPSGMLERFVRV